MVVHNSKVKGFVVEESIESFSEGRMTRVDAVPSMWHGDIVVDRARKRLGTAYDLGQFNCEHLITIAYGHPVDSPQLRAWILVSVLGAILMAVSRT